MINVKKYILFLMMCGMVTNSVLQATDLAPWYKNGFKVGAACFMGAASLFFAQKTLTYHQEYVSYKERETSNPPLKEGKTRISNAAYKEVNRNGFLFLTTIFTSITGALLLWNS